MIARIEAQPLLVLNTVINYVADLATVCAMFIAGFARSEEDGAIQLYANIYILIYRINYYNQRGFSLSFHYISNKFIQMFLLLLC